MCPLSVPAGWHRARRGQLIEFLVIALLQIDDRVVARSADKNHWKAIRRGVGERDQAVQESDAETVKQTPGFRVR
jgi:hypothetical protein